MELKKSRADMDLEWIRLRIRSILEEVLERKFTEDEMDMPLNTVRGFDSMSLMMIFTQMEERFSFEIDLNDIEEGAIMTPNVLVNLAANTLSDEQLKEPFFQKNTIPPADMEPKLSGDAELDEIIGDIIERNNGVLFDVFRDVSNYEYELLPIRYADFDCDVTPIQIAKELAKTRKGTCVSSTYLMHYVLMRMGYNAQCYFGNVHGLKRDLMIHMWNEVIIDGQRYVLDTFYYMKYRLIGYYGLKPETNIYRYMIKYDAADPARRKDIKRDIKRLDFSIGE